MSTLESLLTVAGLAAITLLTRGFFVLPQRQWPMPEWLREGLRYAPVGALAAVVAPDILLHQGQLLSSWRDARLMGAVVASLWFVWRRDILGTIVSGTGTMLIFRLGMGW